MRVAHIARGASAGALFALAGCSDLLGPTGPEVFVSLNLQSPSPGPLTLEAVVGGKWVEVTSTGASEAETEWRGPRFGDVPGRLALLTPGGDTLASAALTLHFQRDHLHWITARVGSRRPLGHCIGDLTIVPLAGARTDTLYLTVGSIPKGAIC